jgi:hypothetical protein
MEFSNDGFRDSLTSTLAPYLFQQLLEQEAAAADRENRIVSVGIIQCNGNVKALSYDLVALNSVLRMTVRSDEFYSRAVANGFWLFIRGNQAAAERALGRVNDELQSGKIALTSLTNVSYQAVERNTQRNIADWLRRIDCASFPNEK